MYEPQVTAFNCLACRSLELHLALLCPGVCVNSLFSTRQQAECVHASTKVSQGASDIAAGVGQAASQAFGGAKQLASDAVGGAGHAASQVAEGVGKLTSDAVEGAGQAASVAAGAVGNAAQGVADACQQKKEEEKK